MLFALGLCLAAVAAHAEQGAVQITPHFENDQPLTVELRNFSKLSVRLTQATLSFQGGADSACTFKLPEAIALGPAEMKSVTLAAHPDVAKCLAPMTARAPQRRLSVITAHELAAMPKAAAPAAAARRGADLTYKLETAKHAAEDKTVWHFIAR
jgi:hypothetical protein